MADFPEQVKNFLQLEDGVDYIIAQHPNSRGDEITAIETAMGALGDPQSYNASLTDLLRLFKSCRIAFADSDNLSIIAGGIAIYRSSNSHIRLRIKVADDTFNWDQLDSGSETVSTQYYVYAVADASGNDFTLLVSTNNVTPTGATYYRLIGEFYNDASGDILEGSVKNYDNVDGDPKTLGSFDTKSTGQTYTAETDGQIHAYKNGPHYFRLTINGTIVAYERDLGDDADDSAGSMFAEIQAGDIWTVTAVAMSATVLWRPYS